MIRLKNRYDIPALTQWQSQSQSQCCFISGHEDVRSYDVVSVVLYCTVSTIHYLLCIIRCNIYSSSQANRKRNRNTHTHIYIHTHTHNCCSPVIDCLHSSLDSYWVYKYTHRYSTVQYSTDTSYSTVWQAIESHTGDMYTHIHSQYAPAQSGIVIMVMLMIINNDLHRYILYSFQYTDLKQVHSSQHHKRNRIVYTQH